MKTSERPWRVVLPEPTRMADMTFIVDAANDTVAICYGPHSEANAKEIVNVINNYGNGRYSKMETTVIQVWIIKDAAGQYYNIETQTFGDVSDVTRFTNGGRSNMENGVCGMTFPDGGIWTAGE